MSFTDDDLKRLKEREEMDLATNPWLDRPSKMQALLVRLEAAEQFRNCWLYTRQFIHSKSGEQCGLCEEFEKIDKAWRKEAGK